MAYFTPGKIFELQKWTDDATLNGKILGIIDNKTPKQAYPCYIFENQQIVEATAAQLTYPELDAESKKKLQELLQEVIRQKKEHKNKLASKALEEEQRQMLLKKEKEEQQKIQKAMPSVIFDTTDLQNGEEPVPGTPSTTPQIIIKAPPKDLYHHTTNNDGIVVARNTVEAQESGVPKGYALVPVTTLKQVVEVKKQGEELEKKELDLISKENELQLQKKQTSMEFQKKELELERKQKEVDLDKKHVVEMEQSMQNDREMRRQKKKERKQHRRNEENGRTERRGREEEEEEERRRKKKKKKKKHKKKDEEDCCTAKSICKCLCKLSSICFIIALVAGVIGAYFYFVLNDDQNVYAFLFWAGAIIAFVFGAGFLCKG